MSLIGIAALSSRGFMQAIIDFQARHGDIVEGPRLGLDTNLPHVTIVQCPFVDSFDAEDVLATLASDVLGGVGRSLDPLNVSYYPLGWLFLNIACAEWLIALQDQALVTMERFIDHSEIDRSKDLAAYTSLERSNYLRYGYRYIGQAFRPHITLGRVEAGVDLECSKELSDAFGVEVGYTERRVERLVFYKAGEAGALSSIIAEIDI
ncbi:MAG: hypothetical protein M3256_22560 [Actinomycetota bacterium]|nr:hypothetical protein [Actinomycetota bacterium]